MAASSKFVTDVIKCCIHVCEDTKGHQIQPRSVKHKLLFEHNFKHNAIVLRGLNPLAVANFCRLCYFVWLRRGDILIDFAADTQNLLLSGPAATQATSLLCFYCIYRAKSFFPSMGGKGCLCCYLPFLCRWQPFAICSAYILSCTSWSLIVFAFYSDLVII